MSVLPKARRLSARFHMIWHVVLGLIFALPATAGPETYSGIALFAILGSLIPDLDHFLFFYFYGRKTNYARTFRGHLHRLQLRKAVYFCLNNHKDHHGIYSHNIATLIGVSLLTTYALGHDSQTVSAFLLGITSHFVFDIFEDYLLKGHLNPNWVGRFQKPA